MKPILFLMSFLFTSAAFADNWPTWRGPNYDGHSKETGIPVSWSATENVAWKVKLPGRSGSSPAVWEDHIFVTATEGGKNLLLCFDRKGATRWKADLGTETPGKHKRYGSGSNPSPVTDGKHVWVYYRSGDLVCVDFSGAVTWSKNLQKAFGEDTLWWDLGSSPVLTETHVIVTCMQSEPSPSYLAAFEKGSGKLTWKTDRNMKVKEESNQAYSTPVVIKQRGRDVLVTLGADFVTAHDALTGAELWRCGGLNPTNHQYWRSIAGPAVADGLVIAPYGRGDMVTAVRLGGKGDVTASHKAWVKTGVGADVPTPVIHQGRAYVLNDSGDLSCINIKTGEVVWQERVEKHRSKYRSSPLLVDGKLYVTREDGKTFVIATGDAFEVLHANELGGEFTLASLAPSNGQIFIRTMEHLYCIGK